MSFLNSLTDVVKFNVETGATAVPGGSQLLSVLGKVLSVFSFGGKLIYGLKKEELAQVLTDFNWFRAATRTRFFQDHPEIFPNSMSPADYCIAKWGVAWAPIEPGFNGEKDWFPFNPLDLNKPHAPAWMLKERFNNQQSLVRKYIEDNWERYVSSDYIDGRHISILSGPFVPESKPITTSTTIPFSLSDMVNKFKIKNLNYVLIGIPVAVLLFFAFRSK